MDKNDTSEEMARIRQRMAEPGAEEHAVHDHEGFEDAPVGEWASFKAICALADFIEAHGRLGACLFRHFGEYLDAAAAAFDDYAGEYPSLADSAETLHRECGTAIPEALQYYIDWEAMGRDLELWGEVFTVALEFEAVHVFWSR